jgi:HNH endonuclease
MIKYTRELLEPLVKKHISISGMLRELRMHANGGNTSHLGRVIKKLGLDTSHFKYGSKTGNLPKFLPGQLEGLIKKHTSVAGILKELGCTVDGRCHRILSQVIRDSNLDISHFTGRSWNKGKKMPIGKGNKQDPRHFFTLRNEFSRRVSGTKLKSALLEIGRPDVCEYCGQKSFWNGKILVLEIDHKNGKFWDDREENLAISCPNCHSQLPTCGIKNVLYLEGH